MHDLNPSTNLRIREGDRHLVCEISEHAISEAGLTLRLVNPGRNPFPASNDNGKHRNVSPYANHNIGAERAVKGGDLRNTLRETSEELHHSKEPSALNSSARDSVPSEPLLNDQLLLKGTTRTDKFDYAVWLGFFESVHDVHRWDEVTTRAGCRYDNPTLCLAPST
jgi:hypothetical protein